MDTFLSAFTATFATANRIDIARWVFRPGMGHLDTVKWWEDTGPRGHVHYGVDLLWYETPAKEMQSIEPGMSVPASPGGTVISVFEDLMAHTVALSYGSTESEMNLLSLYAHVEPLVEAASRPGLGDIIARVAPSAGGAVPAHIHLSLCLVPASLTPEELNWDYLNHSKNVIHLDPARAERPSPQG